MMLQLDSTNMCNYNCSFCYKSKQNQFDKKNISLEQIEGIINRSIQLEGISLVNNGEFFCNPDWKKIFDYLCDISAKRNIFLSLNTNGFYLDENASSFIIEKLKHYNNKIRITFSINAFSSEIYKKICGNKSADLNNIIDKILYFTDTLIENKLENIVVCYQSLITSENKHEISQYIDFWKNKLIKRELDFEICEDGYNSNKRFLITLRRLFTGKKEDEDIFKDTLLSLIEKYNIKTSQNLEYEKDFFKRKACKNLFKYPACNEEYYTICCRDTEFKHKYKRIDENITQKEIDYKKYHLRGEFEKIDLCRNCNGYEIMTNKDLNALFDHKWILEYEHRIKTGYGFEFYEANIDEDSKEYAVDFFRNNDLLTQKSNIHINEICLNNEIEYNRKGELDFCVRWTRFIEFKNKTLFTGCDICKIQVEDYSRFLEKLNNMDYSEIPDRCYYCDMKFSIDPLRDRAYVYGKECYNSPVLFGNDITEKNRMIEYYSMKGDFTNVMNILDEISRFEYTKKALAIFIKLKMDDKKIFEFFKKIPDNWLKYEYAFYTEDFFQEMCSYLISNEKRMLPLNLTLKILKYYFEDIIYNNSIKDYVETIARKIIQKDIIFYKEADNELRTSLLFYIINSIDDIKDERDFLKNFDKWYDFIIFAGVKKAFIKKLLEISELWNFDTFYKALMKITDNEDENREEIIHHRLIRSYTFEGFENFLNHVYSFSLLHLDDVKDCVHNGVMELYSNKEYNEFLEIVSNYEIFYIDNIQNTVLNVFTYLLENKKYYSLIKYLRILFSKKKDFTVEIINRILKTDFHNYSYSFVRLLYCGNKYNIFDEKSLYLIYSHYMRKKDFKKAYFIYMEIKEIERFIQKDSIKNTELYLLKKNKKFIRYFIRRFFG